MEQLQQPCSTWVGVAMERQCPVCYSHSVAGVHVGGRISCRTLPSAAKLCMATVSILIYLWTLPDRTMTEDFM